MKRKICLILMVALLISCMVVPVSAADTDDYYINILDYATANDSGRNSFGSNGTSVASAVYSLPFSPYIRYVDIVFTSAGGDAAGVTVNGQSLTMVKIAHRLYRAFGTVTVAPRELTLEITSAVTGVSYSIVSFKAATFSNMSYPETGFLAVGTDYWASSFVYMPDVDSAATVYIDDTSASPVNCNFVAYIYPDHWKRYDYMDFYLKIHATALDSLAVNLDGISIPYSMSYCDISTGDWVSWESVGGESIIVQNEIDTVYLMVEIDLSNIDRTSSSTPQITINGQYLENFINNYVSLVSVVGHISYDTVSSNSFFLMTLIRALQDGFFSLGTLISEHSASIMHALEDLFTNLQTNFNSLFTAISDQTIDLREEMATGFNRVISHFVYLKNWINAQTATLEAAIRGDSADGEELREGADDIQNSVGEISKFEEDQQAVLDNNFAAIQDTVTVTGFASALAFVQHYSEGIFLGMGDFFIVFSLPLFLGLFFYICSRVPGMTRWRSRPPKDGDSG